MRTCYSSVNISVDIQSSHKLILRLQDGAEILTSSEKLQLNKNLRINTIQGLCFEVFQPVLVPMGILFYSFKCYNVCKY